MDLATRDCIPCRGDVPPLDDAAIEPLLSQLNGWQVEDGKNIFKHFEFKDFARAHEFVNRVAEIAEEQNHHPEIWFTWGKVRLDIRTHSIDGLTESDFVLAAKIDRLNGD